MKRDSRNTSMEGGFGNVHGSMGNSDQICSHTCSKISTVVINSKSTVNRDATLVLPHPSSTVGSVGLVSKDPKSYLYMTKVISFSMRVCLLAKQNSVPVEIELYELLGVSFDASEGGSKFVIERRPKVFNHF